MFDRVANIFDQAFDQTFILALGHDPDKRLGAGLANDNPPGAIQLFIGGRHGFLDGGVIKWFGRFITDAFQALRQRLKNRQSFGRRPPLADKFHQNL